jgi:translocation and assembly module TamB
MQPNTKTTKKRSLGAKIGRGVAIFLLSIILLVVLVLVLLQTAPVQNFARKKIVSYLETKLKTRVEIAKLDVDFPKMLVLEGVYIEDRTKDTLIAGKQLKVDLDMWKLLHSQVQINEINLNQITTKIKRQLPDTVFNYQFIVDAFASPTSTPTKKDTAAMQMAIDKIIVDKTHLVFFDVITGNDVDIYLNHFDTHIATFDPTHLRYDVPVIALNGVHGHINQTKPLAVTAVNTNPDSTKAAEAPAYFNFTNNKVLLSDFDVSYNNAVSAMGTRLQFKNLNLYPRIIDMKNSIVAIDKIELNGLNGNVSIGSTADAKVIKVTDQNKKEVAVEYLPWRVTVDAIRLDNNNFKFDDNTKPRMARGMDYGHMDIKDLTLHADNFLFHNDTIATNITEGAMRDKSGFVLNKMQADVLYTQHGASLQNLLIQTPGSEIKRSAIISYPSLAAIQKQMGLLNMDINIDHSYVQVKDILTFVPALAAQPAFRNPSQRLYLNSRVKGNLNRLVVDYLQFRGFQNTNVDIAGVINNSMDPKAVNGDLKIRRFTTSRGDIMTFAPKGSIPKTITIPEAISVNGALRGGIKNTFADLNINTSLGNAKVRGQIANATNPNIASYAATILTSGLNVGRIIQQPQNVGTISASFTVNGVGFDPEKARANVKGVVYSADVMKYNYRNLRLDGSLAHQRFTANASMNDPNLDFTVHAQGDMAGSMPGFVVNANIDSIKTQPLHLTPDAIIYRGKIVANFPQFNLDALNGDLLVTNSLLVMNGQRVNMDTLSVVASNGTNGEVIAVKSDFLNAQLQGQYKLTQLGDIFIEAIQPYYAINTTGKMPVVDPYNFTITGQVVDHPTLHAFLPDLKRFDSIGLHAAFVSGEGLNASLNAPHIVYGTNVIDNVTLTANGVGNTLNIATNIGQVSSGTSVALYNTSLNAALANNKINFALNIKDKGAKNKYHLAGLLAQEPNNIFSFSLRPDSLMLNYDPWSINPDNLIRFGSTLVNANNFNLSKGNQHLIINSLNSSANSPMQVSFNNFSIATLTAFVQSDSLLVDGTLNGNVELRNLLQQPNFTTDLNLNNLALKKDTIGDVNIKVNNNTENVFATNVTISGRGNDVALTGNYYLKPANNSNFDFNLNIRQLPFKTLEAVSMGTITQSTGNLTGSVAINGTVKDPHVDGGINFNKTGFNVVMLGSYFTIDGETVKVSNKGIRFDTFTIKDSANNSLVIDGAVNTTNYINYGLDLTIKAENFRALNTTKRENQLYYGKLYFNSNLSIKGTETAPIVDGSLRVNENTNLTVVLPQSQPGVEDRKGVVEFVDMDAPANDSLFKQTLAYDSSFNKSLIKGFDITANIEIVKEAVFNIVVDEGNGDFLNLQGTALLNGGIDPSGKITLTGSYVLDKGGYELSFNFLHRKFEMQKGSTITWTGEPTAANVDVTAVYVANTSALDLVSDQIDQSRKGYYMQKLPFQVKLIIKGELMKPDLSFDIDLPTENNLRVSQDIVQTVDTKLDQLRTEPSELNKQVFALLLLNRFVGENPFASQASQGFDASLYAKQSVSKILTEQLNKLAGDLIAGIDISFDVNSTEDYSTGAAAQRTDFNVALSKRLLNDRLKVTVGSNFELEGPQPQGNKANSAIGNIALDYNLTKDGRYLIRAYSRNEYEGIIEGYVVETGLRFIMSVDYNKFKQIFMDRQLRRERRKQDRQDKKDTTPTQATTSTDTPIKDTTSVVQFEKVSADDRKAIPATVKDSTNEN